MNHGPLWKSYASKVNLHYGYDIKRCDGDKSQEDRMRLSGGDGSIKFTHKLVCDKCKQVFYRTKTSRLVTHPERYHCKCGGHIIKEY